MADTRNVQRTEKRPEAKAQSPRDLGKAKSARVFEQFKKNLGQPQLNVADLGPLAQLFMRGLSGHFAQLAEKNGLIPDGEVVQAYKELRTRHQKDQILAKPFEGLDRNNGELDSRKFEIREADERGKFKLSGSLASDAHAVSRLFKELGLDPNGFGQDIAEVLDFAGSKRMNLSDPQTWSTLVTRMATAALTQPGGVKEKLAAAAAGAVGAITEVNAAAKTKASGEVTSQTSRMPAQGLGLAKTAAARSNTGSQTNALSIRAALLSGLNDQNERVERTAGQVLAAIFRELGVDPDKEVKKTLHLQIRDLLTDKSTASGKADVGKIMDRVLGALAKASPENAQLAELSGVIQSALQGEGKVELSDGLREAFGAAIATGLADLVAAKAGVKAKGPKEMSDKLLPILQELFEADAKHDPKTEAKKGVEGAEQVQGKTATETPEVDLSRWSGDRPDIEQRFKDAALEVLMNEGMTADHPRATELVHALGEVLQKSMDPHQGQLDPAIFAVNLQRWLASFAGLSPTKLDALEHQLGAAIQAHTQLEAALLDAKAKYADLQGQQSSSASREQTKHLEGELYRLQREITGLEQQVTDGQKKLAGEVALLQKDGLRRLSEFVVHGTRCGEAKAQSEAPTAGAMPPGGGHGGGAGGPGGPGAPGGPGGPGGPEGPDGPGRPKRSFDRDFRPATGILPGFNMGGRPEDEYSNKNLTIQQERAIKCGEILADPSLTIEDKIFLFMMWFVAFSDKERERKLEDLVQMDREAARIQKTKDEKLAELNSLREAKRMDEAKLVQAESAVRRAERDSGGAIAPEKMQKLTGAVEDAKKNISRRDEAIRNCEHEHAELKRQGDQAPKSREVLFMEIERLNQLRDKIMNMARSILENSNRNIEKIFR